MIGENTMENAKKEILEKLDIYIQAAVLADVELAKQCVYNGEHTSFIHPRGHHIGFEDVKTFFTHTMGEFFITRELSKINEPSIAIYGDSAVLEFYWHFKGLMRDDGETIIESDGRETQVFQKFPDEGWKIVHIHYSNMPVTGRGEGF